MILLSPVGKHSASCDTTTTSYTRDVEEENAGFLLETVKCKEIIRDLERDVSLDLNRNQVQLERSNELNKRLEGTYQRNDETIKNLKREIALLRNNVEEVQKEKDKCESSLRKFRQRAMVAEVSNVEMEWSVNNLKSQVSTLKGARNEVAQQNSSLRRRDKDAGRASFAEKGKLIVLI
jgi:chromosome segregation ATPase